VILAALYLLWAYQRVFHGEPDEQNRSFKELTAREGLVLLPMIAAIVFCGIYPKPMLDRIEPSVRELMTHIEQQTGYVEPALPVAEHDDSEPGEGDEAPAGEEPADDGHGEGG
jgi:NADH-quinone oxidoreductase subunit M